MKQKLVLLQERGFTLVELMVVVAIIGILSAIAVPNFKKYQAKSKTSEAKLQLSAAYTAEQSFYSDYDTYNVCLKYMGYNPTNEVLARYYAVGFGTDATCAACGTLAAANGAILAAGGCAPGAADSVFAAGKTQGTAGAPIGAFTSGELTTIVITQDTFDMGAIGIIDRLFNTTATASRFRINETKLIRNQVAGY